MGTESPSGEKEGTEARLGLSPGQAEVQGRTSGDLEHRHIAASHGGGNIEVERWCFRTANALGLQKRGHFPLLHRQALGQVLGEAEQGLVPVQPLPARLLAQVS